MANHGMRARRGSPYLDLPNTSVADRAKEHHDLLTSTDTGPFYGKNDHDPEPSVFDHAAAAEDLRAVGAPDHIIQYHANMADQGPANQNSASLADRADQTKHILEEE